MESICPTCLAQVEHPEGASDVECSCGAHFDPNQAFDELAPLDQAMQSKPTAPPKTAVATPDIADGPSQEEPVLEDPPMESPPEQTSPAEMSPFSSLDEAFSEPQAGDMSLSEPSDGDGNGNGNGNGNGTGAIEPGAEFLEASQAFDEIREFGESVLPGQQDVPATPLEEPAPEPAQEKPPQTQAPAPGGMRMTSGAALQGFKISEYFTPISLGCAVDEDAEEPLKPAFDKLWTKAQAAGGNAVIDLKWKLASDGKKVLISGTPVKCAKAD